MQFWKDHPTMRVALIAVFFFASMALILAGAKMTGQLAGLGLMVFGVMILTLALAIYNSPSRPSK